MKYEKSALLEQAHRCRRLAHAINNSDVAAKLTALAQDYEERAARLAQMDVASRAYHLWEQAGHPEGRADEFYFEAERQLQEELDKEKLRTWKVPDLAAPPIEPPEIQPPTPGNPTEPPPEEPPGNPRPEVPPPVREPGQPAPPDNLPGQTPDEFPVRGPNNPTTPNPAVS